MRNLQLPFDHAHNPLLGKDAGEDLQLHCKRHTPTQQPPNPKQLVHLRGLEELADPIT